MKVFLLAAVVATASLVQADGGNEATSAELNVNSRYMVESVDLSPGNDYPLSGRVMDEIHQLIGERLNVDALERLSRRMTEELRARSVTFRVYRGNQPAHVRVQFEVDRSPTSFDVALSGITYSAREGWTGTGQATLTSGYNMLTVAGLSNGDDEVERYSGIRARFDRLKVGSSRVRLGFEFDSYREQWQPATLASLPAASLLAGPAYRTRTNLEPSATFVLYDPLTLTLGASFERMQPNGIPGPPQTSNILFDILHYHQHWESPEGSSRTVDASYNMRAATSLFGSDSLYTKHLMKARYAWKRVHQTAEVTLMAGMIYGRAPLFERFVLGNDTTLRGWSKFDLDPLGGNRVVHASVTYGYHIMRVFYDTGAVWDQGTKPEERHSVGVGVTTGLGIFGKNALLVALAFPIRQGHMEPVLIAGMNF